MKCEYAKGSNSIAIMQPYFFPYIGYFQLIQAVDLFIIYDDVNYINRGYVNRNSILVNGVAHQITLALSHASQNKPINKIEIDSNANKILKTIEMAYKKSPQFENVFPMLRDVLLTTEKNLAKMLSSSLQVITHYLGLKTKFVLSSTIDKDNTLKSGDKLIEVCRQLGISNYVNSIGGQVLYDKSFFKQRNVDLFFLKTLPFTYKQFNNTFIPNLSIIDLLMFNEKEQLLHALQQYTLI